MKTTLHSRVSILTSALAIPNRAAFHLQRRARRARPTLWTHGVRGPSGRARSPSAPFIWFPARLRIAASALALAAAADSGLSLAAETGASAQPAPIQETSDIRGLRFGVGPVWRTGSKIKANWSPAGIRQGLGGLVSGRSTGGASSVPAEGYADRDYLDGFVYRDLGTEDPETDVPGLTWYWGYERASQYSGSDVSFHTDVAGTETKAGFVPAEPASYSEDVELPGVDFTASWMFAERRGKASFAFGLAGGASWFFEEGADFDTQRTLARSTTSTYRFVDVYAAPHPGFPGAPYGGTEDGPGYLIRNTPDSRTRETVSSRTVVWDSDSAVEIDVGVADLRLGPSVRWDVARRLSLGLTPQVRLAHVDLEAESLTTIRSRGATVSEIRESGCADEWIWGLGLEGEAKAWLSDRWSLAFSAAYDWWSDDASVSAMPYDVEFEMGGLTLAFAVGMEF